MIRFNLCFVSCFAAVMACAFCASFSYGQVNGGSQVGGGNLLVPINIDDPYVYDKNFVSSVVADLFGEQFSFSNSMLWIGEHVDEDSAKPRILAMTNRLSGGNVEEVGVAEGVEFTELARFSAAFLGFTSYSGATNINGIPFAFENEEYGDVVVGWMDNSSGVSRLVVGVDLVLRFEATNPIGERGEFYAERFYPIKRFYNEGQAISYAEDMANESVLVNGVESGSFDCSTLPAGNERDYCFCLHRIYTNYGLDRGMCLGEPDLGQAIAVGVATGGGAAVSGGIVKRILKRASGIWGTVTLGVGGFVAGSTAMYGGQYAQCMLKAKSTKDAALNHAANAKNQADANGTAFECPISARPV